MAIFIGREPSIRSLLQAYLETLNFRLESAATEQEMNQLYSTRNPALIIFDVSYQMEKDMDQLREICALDSRKGIPVIALISHGDCNTLQSLSDYGVSDYFTKPLDFQAFDTFFIEKIGNVASIPNAERKKFL